MTNDTYLCARASGDMTYLNWLHDRLVLVYGESENVDYVQTLNNFSVYFHRRKHVPSWLNWIMRRYHL